jgi:hypothetical protein
LVLKGTKFLNLFGGSGYDLKGRLDLYIFQHFVFLASSSDMFELLFGVLHEIGKLGFVEIVKLCFFLYLLSRVSELFGYILPF